MKISKRHISAGSLAVVFWLFNSCATNPVTGKKELMLLSKDQEIEMGKQANPEIISYFGVYEDEALQTFIQQKGEKMAALSHRPELNYQFRIVDSPVVNAFAVPRGIRLFYPRNYGAFQQRS